MDRIPEWLIIDSVQAYGSSWHNGYADLHELGSANVTLLWNMEKEWPYAYMCWYFGKDAAKRLGFNNVREEVFYPEYLCVENEGTEDEAYIYPVVVKMEISAYLTVELEGDWIYEGKKAEEILESAKEASIDLHAIYEQEKGWVLKTYDKFIGDYREVTPAELAEALGFKRARRF